MGSRRKIPVITRVGVQNKEAFNAIKSECPHSRRIVIPGSLSFKINAECDSMVFSIQASGGVMGYVV